MYSSETDRFKKDRKLSFLTELNSNMSVHQQNSSDTLGAAKNSKSMSYKQRQKVFD